MTWWRKLFRLPEPSDELYEKVHQEEVEIEEKVETLEEWQQKAINYRLEKQCSDFIKTPYDKYVIKYCFNCIDFNPKKCFNNDYSITTDEIKNCAKLRLINKKLDGSDE